ncbi:TetR/AcrR family transcriptional regulator [Nocardia carnea]|uniref:TetR/AcrR family transcriptional regulator n=1 Tax=Nocardia carnea TaxID=37328 RepID=A0ABW7TKS1_9NOCA|nr:TetR/AcrR family transcriptional regulator C-terminal domain-containing protein [Nocardia carnea]
MNDTRAGPFRSQDRSDDQRGVRRARPLTRVTVLAAALEIIDRDSVEQLTMRRLGKRLGHDPMAPYRHAADKSALLDGVTEFVLEQLRVDIEDPDWRHQLRAVARDFRRLAVAHPHVVPLLATHPLVTPLGRRPLGTLRPMERILELLIRAEFSGSDALFIHRALFGFLYGHALNELHEIVDRPEEGTDLPRLGMDHLPIGEFPLLRGLAAEQAGYDGGAELERGLDILITGLSATLTPAAPQPEQSSGPDAPRHRAAGASSGPGRTAAPEPGNGA